MSMLKALFEQIDVLFESAEIDYQALKKLTFDETLFNDYNNQRIVNSYLFNFIKLQDKIGAKLFKAVLIELKEYDETMPMRDILDRLEKLHIIENTVDWDVLREIRNAITHEYPLDIEERLENITMAMDAFGTMKKMSRSLKSAIQL